MTHNCEDNHTKGLHGRVRTSSELRLEMDVLAMWARSPNTGPSAEVGLSTGEARDASDASNSVPRCSNAALADLFKRLCGRFTLTDEGLRTTPGPDGFWRHSNQSINPEQYTHNRRSVPVR